MRSSFSSQLTRSRGWLAFFDMPEVVEAVLQLEVMGRNGNLADAPGSLTKLTDEMNRLRSALAVLVAEKR